MNRYKFTEENIAQAIDFLKGKSKDSPVWAKRFKADLSVKKAKVYYKGLEVIPKSKVDDYLRTEMFKRDGTLPFGRDAAHHKLKTSVVGVTRRHLMKFIKSQDIFEMTKAVVPKAKSKGGKKVKTYTIETDLVFIRKNDLVNSNKRFEKSVAKEETYIVSTVEKTTGLSRLGYSKTKDPKIVTPIVLKHIRSIAKALKVHPRTCAYRSDSGTEFNMVEIKKVVPDAKNVKVAASVEKKNQDLQRVFYRILKSRRAVSIRDGLSQTQKLLNETLNRIQGGTPNELVEKSTKTFNIKVYNRSRGSYVAGDKRKPFEVGQRVRIVKKKDKGLDLKYKTYKGLTYSKKVYIIKKITTTTPRKYWVNNSWKTIDQLKSTEAEDQKTKDMVKSRDEAREAADKEVIKRGKAYEKKKADVMNVVKEAEIAEGVRRRTRAKDPAKERVKQKRLERERLQEAQIRHAERTDEAKAKKRGMSPARRRRVLRSRKYEREGEEEYKPTPQKPRKVRRV